MTLPNEPLNVPFIRLLDWCKDNRIRLCRFDGTSENDEITLENMARYFPLHYELSEYLPCPDEGYTKLQGLVETGSDFKRVFTLEFEKDEGWFFTQLDISTADLNYYVAVKGPQRPRRIDLNLSDEFLYSKDVDNVDDQYWVFNKMNIYKDDIGYFTAPAQLDDKDIGNISLLLGCYRHQLSPQEHVYHQFQTLINVLELTGFLYNENLFKHCRHLIENYVNTGFAKVFNISNLNTGADGKHSVHKYVQLPNFPDHIVRIGGEKEVLDIINVRYRNTYRLYFYDL